MLRKRDTNLFIVEIIKLAVFFSGIQKPPNDLIFKLFILSKIKKSSYWYEIPKTRNKIQT